MKKQNFYVEGTVKYRVKVAITGVKDDDEAVNKFMDIVPANITMDINGKYFLTFVKSSSFEDISAVEK